MMGDVSEKKEKNKKKVHVLVMPFPTQGPLNPMLHLSIRLALHGLEVSFVLPQSFKANMDMAREEAGVPPPHQLGLDFHFLEIPDIVAPDFAVAGGKNAAGSMDMVLLEQMLRKVASHRGFIEETILRSRDGPNPISCIISDSFLYWTQDMANKLGIKRVWVSTGNATILSMGLLVANGKIHAKAREEDFLPSLDPAIKKGLLSTNICNPERKKYIDMLFCGTKESFCAVVNSFEDLERHIVNDDLVMGITGVKFLGPMLPLSFFGMDTMHIEASIMGACARKEEAYCINWLDTQLPSSVLYIAFGSIGVVTPNQLEEIASGIEKSQQAFLWALRSPANQYLPPGFLERSHGFGLVVSWAPQLRVLKHKSIGGFLTHCGWNSTIESICAGVPMLCLPLFAEQPENALLITKLWKVGMALEKTQVGEDENGALMMVSKEEVERKVRVLMGGEEEFVVDIRYHAQEFKEVAKKSLFGSTNDAMIKLIVDLEEATSKA